MAEKSHSLLCAMFPVIFLIRSKNFINSPSFGEYYKVNVDFNRANIYTSESLYLNFLSTGRLIELHPFTSIEFSQRFPLQQPLLSTQGVDTIKRPHQNPNHIISKDATKNALYFLTNFERVKS